MAADYPTSVKSFATKVDNVDLVMAADINDIQTEVAAIETQLVTNKLATLTSAPAANRVLTTDGSGNPTWGGGWAAWTPSWTASTTNPTIGDGTLTGRYSRIGNIVIASIYLLFGSTSNAGAGTYYFSLPVAANSSYTSYWNGTWNIRDFGTDNFAGAVKALNSTTIQLPYTGSPFYVTHSYPMTWANNDSLCVLWIYEAA